ncbi:MAG: aminotransferase class I/II-fold pyridoxal phosphate-dependent enzyme [Gammaproteobacteria bacterium]|nr:aminotransferase class I/II-fold pyridoxal phosphate-dependent enzyme [Gammaproteobacteria bacterium]
MSVNADLLASFKSEFLEKSKTNENAGGDNARVRAMDVTNSADYKIIEKIDDVYGREGMNNPYFMPRSGSLSNKVTSREKEFICYSGYNYLGLANDARVISAAKHSLDQYGTHAGAARMVGGEMAIHTELESTLCDAFGFESCVTTVGGYMTNVATIGYLMGKRDLIIMDEYMHNSGVMGAVMADSRRIVFPHNDFDALATLLNENRGNYEKAMIIVEGAYSMDGDLADLPRLVELKKKHNCWLMVDEAHSLGVVGKSGRGLCEHWGVDTRQIDIIMGTLSKSFASCGGFLGGSEEMIRLLRFFAPGVLLYSTGLPPASAAAANRAINVMLEESWRVENLQNNVREFSRLAKERRFDIGRSGDSAVVPVMLGDSMLAVHLMSDLQQIGIIAHAVMYPVVPENEARLRFFITSEHTQEDFIYTLDSLKRILANTTTYAGV